ncbi:hypothetical protein [Lewinella sp. IMCC34183]|uniref:hypothetical protein n=1 Tax=Lewinella sp. IMCC34183 TaxID=2248762 RepID=UPI000E28A52F|nr:hypothetical protein [Lewinella sp. IMCC34183]
MTLLYLILALLSGLAPRGMDTVSQTTAGEVSYSARLADDDHAVMYQAPHGQSHLPESPAEREEEEVREFKGYDAHSPAVLRTCLSFLAAFLEPSPCLASPPQVLRKPIVEPVVATSRTILHQVFVI